MTRKDLATVDLKQSVQDGVPVLYERAKAAILACESIDECKYWSDRSAAMRTYADQIHDDALRVAALKIQARAERRCGAILKETPSGSAANLKQNRKEVTLPSELRKEGTLPSVTRKSVADAAGLTEHERKTAVRLASIPKDEFEATVESDNPPTITELAARGTASRPRPPEPAPTPADPRQVAEALALLRQLAAFCEMHDPVSIATASSMDVDLGRNYVGVIDRWLDRFVTNLPEERAA